MLEGGRALSASITQEGFILETSKLVWRYGAPIIEVIKSC